MVIRTWLLVAVSALAIAASACTDRNGTEAPAATADSNAQAGDFLVQVGRALDGAGTYRLTVNQTNLVLPRWGGSDGGTVSVDLQADRAVADLQRTGDGRYAVVLRGGETYFKRETCSSWARVQDGEEVLAPFILTSEDLAHSKLIEVLPSTTSTASSVRVDLEGLGEVTMEVEKSTSRPIRITSETLTNNGRPLEWSFSEWGEKVQLPGISTNRLSGPGGNPC